MDIKVGDIMCDLHYFKVKTKNDQVITFEDVTTGQEWGMPTASIDENLDSVWSADAVEKDETLCRTSVINKLMEAGIRPFTVEYVKLNGDNRKIRGRFIKSEPLLGRSVVVDLDKVNGDDDTAIRQIDHRTIKSLILDGVKYNVGSN